MTNNRDKLKAFAVQLYKINAVKFGENKTKIGMMTPVYCDLRVIVSHPKVMNEIVRAKSLVRSIMRLTFYDGEWEDCYLWMPRDGIRGVLADLIVENLKDVSKFDIICGVPYTALPIASTVSYKTDLPMVMRRKEAKDYGTKKLIEGTFAEGDKCLIIEDVVTSGSSILETVKDLKEAGLKCEEAIVLLNREQGGKDLLHQKGIKMHALLTMTELMSFLKEEGYIDDEMCEKVATYVKNSQVDVDSINKNKMDRLQMKFEDRVQYAKNSVAKKLFQLMSEKKTNLCVAADLTDPTEILNLAESVGPHICLFKTHIDIVENFNDNFIECLKNISKKHNFLLFEDRKFADIGTLVQQQFSKGIFAISSWASLVTAHSLMGSAILTAIEQAEGLQSRGVFLLIETSAKGSHIDEKYTKNSIKMGLEHPELVTGFVAQSPLFLESLGFIQLTPGVQLGVSGDNLGQQYNSPECVINERGADIAVVGRGITQSKNPESSAQEYKKLLWNAYLNRVK